MVLKNDALYSYNIASDCDFCLDVIVLLQMLLERKSKEVGKLIKETDKKINDLAENINEAKVNSGVKCIIVLLCVWKWALKGKFKERRQSLSVHTHSDFKFSVFNYFYMFMVLLSCTVFFFFSVVAAVSGLFLKKGVLTILHSSWINNDTMMITVCSTYLDVFRISFFWQIFSFRFSN